MAKIQKGQKVSFLYSSYLSDGTCVDQETQEPINLSAGLSTKTNSFANFIASSLIGMSENQVKHVNVPAKFAFGEREETKVFKVPHAGDKSMEIGQELSIEVGPADHRELLDGTVVKIDDTFAHIDTNHPLAGQSMLVHIKVISFQ